MKASCMAGKPLLSDGMSFRVLTFLFFSVRKRSGVVVAR